MKCPRCGNAVEKGWRFCPFCGTKKQEGFFTKFRREVDRMQKNIENGTFGEPDIKTNTRGFTINIRTGSDMEPKVQVRTMGDVNQNEINRQLRNMGVRIQNPVQKKPLKENLKLPEKTKEPETKVYGNVIEIDLPKTEKSKININELESSIEVRAIGKDNAYFKIINKPENTSIINKEFRNGKLRLEVG